MGWFLRVWYSFAIAFSVAASTWGSTRNINFWTRVVILAAAFFAAGTAAYFFQGKGIQKSFEKESVKSSVQPKVKIIIENAVKPEIENSTKLEGEVKIENNDNKVRGQKCCTKNNTTAWILQFLFSGASAGSSLVSRYFVLGMFWNLFRITASNSIFWGIFGASLFIKLIFDFTNESYETNEGIAKRFNGDKPFYAPFFRPLSHTVVIKLIRGIGSGDHAFMDDLLPWLGYLPEEAVTYLAENPGALALVAGIGAVVGIPLAILIFAQTYYYEGSHTEKNLRAIANQLKEPKEYLPSLIAKPLINTINILAPLHGAAGAMPVYFIVEELLAGSPAKWAVNAALTLLVFLGVAAGFYYSEGKKAKKEIAKRTPPAKKVSENKVSENQPLLKDQKSLDVSINPASANVSMTYF